MSVVDSVQLATALKLMYQYVYSVDTIKNLYWQGSSYEDYPEFPDATQDDLGYQLHLLQSGSEPIVWKMLKNLGKGITVCTKLELLQVLLFIESRMSPKLQTQ